MNKSAGKQMFSLILAILAVTLMLLPFLTSFNDLITRLVIKLDFYKIIQNVIVPWELRMVGVMLLPLGLKPAVTGEYLSLNSRDPFLIEIVWNCIGWQSLLFFTITTIIGFQGNRYTKYSKFKALIIGLLGTSLVNLLRMAIVVLSAYYLGQKVAILFHDYGSVIVVVFWLVFYWWFIYSYVLEERIVD